MGRPTAVSNEKNKQGIAFVLTFSKLFQLSLPETDIKKLKKLYAKGTLNKRLREKYLEHAGIEIKSNIIKGKRIVKRRNQDLLDDTKPDFALNKRKWNEFIDSIQASLGFATSGEFVREYQKWCKELIQEKEEEIVKENKKQSKNSKINK